VKVGVRQYDEDAGLDCGHRTVVVEPNLKHNEIVREKIRTHRDGAETAEQWAEICRQEASFDVFAIEEEPHPDDPVSYWLVLKNGGELRVWKQSARPKPTLTNWRANRWPATSALRPSRPLSIAERFELRFKKATKTLSLRSNTVTTSPIRLMTP
jgi:hypothetical protein